MPDRKSAEAVPLSSRCRAACRAPCAAGWVPARCQLVVDGVFDLVDP
mgnify:CR=1 FL=1